MLGYLNHFEMLAINKIAGSAVHVGPNPPEDVDIFARFALVQVSIA